MADTNDEHRGFRFGEFTLDADRGELFRDGEPVKIRPKSFDVLQYLAGRQGKLVSRDELLDSIWAGTVVTEDAVTQCLIDIRKALGDADQTMIRTVPRRGYIFELTVDVLGEATPPETTPVADGRQPRWAVWTAGAAILGLVVMGAYQLLGDAGDGERDASSVASENLNAIAVLPLENLSDDPDQEFFVAGMHDALIGELSRISGLRVTSKTSTLSFRDTDSPLNEIADFLGVATLIEGSVYRFDDGIRITVKLIDAQQDRTIWTRTLEGSVEEALNIQRDIARQVAAQVQVTLTQDEAERLNRAEQVNEQAYLEFLRGQFHVERFSPQDFAIAERHYLEALATDPNYALAILGRGRVCGFRAQAGLISPDEARETCLPLIERALELDPQLAEAYLGYARHMTWQEFNWEAAGLAYRRAIELNPNYAEARMFYSHFLTITGKTDEGSQQMAIARARDPLNPFVEGLHGAQRMMVGDLKESIDVINRLHAAYPGFGFGYDVVWISNYGIGNEPAAISAASDYFRVTQGDSVGAEALESAYENGDFSTAMGLAAEVLIEHRETAHVPPGDIAMMFEHAERVDDALDWWETAIETNDPRAPYIGVLVQSPALRAHPRYIELLRNMRLNHWATVYSDSAG
ncbi:MAG: winged helix-turn-helix domain-containing protein [Woeseiaceae bacterium]|nr:winged helix-turn-helix domain-containing protein [Woeseiaceae bacterium]